MARRKSLHAAYSAIAQLRKNSEQVTVARVAELSGVGRSTLYQDQADWLTVMAVIEGGEIPETYASVVAPSPRAGNPAKLQSLAQRVNSLARQVEESTKLVDEVFQRLVDELQYYFAASQAALGEKSDSYKRRIELSNAYDEIGRLKAELLRLNALNAKSNVVEVTGRKLHIVIPSNLHGAKLVDAFRSSLQSLMPDQAVSKAVTTVTLVCGLPLSGRSSWIEKQVVHGPGISLFIEGTFYTAEIRTLLLQHMRRSCEAELRCVWILTDGDTCLGRASRTNRTEAYELIRSLGQKLELPSVAEPFDLHLGVYR